MPQTDRSSTAVAVPPDLYKIGVREGQWRPLREQADMLRYLDLMGREPLFDGVVEHQGQPILFVRQREAPDVGRLARVVSLREDGAAIAILTPGRLTLYEADLSDQPPRVVEPHAEWLPSRLSEPRPVGAVRGLIKRLMHDVTTRLCDGGLSPDAALALTGRALLIRFLLDRKILTQDTAPGVFAGHLAPERLLSDARTATATSAWLDRTFNGDLLPVPEGCLASLSPQACRALGDILHKAENGQLVLSKDWPGLDFAHIPVGVLSEVYEDHKALHEPDAKKRHSVHYTPRHLAEYLAREAIGAAAEPSKACVLDPATGAGVFLVAAYHELVRHRWAKDGVRPDRAVLRSILHHQLRGYDIDATGLRLAALALYLTALELDPDPAPPAALRFDDLKDEVLWLAPPGLGSLDPAFAEFDVGQFDVVIGNPPWTSSARMDGRVLDAELEKIAPGAKSKDKRPDLPFLFYATRWAKPGGRIAMLVHGRFLFEHGQGHALRSALFSTLRVTGILNGSALGHSEHFWPGIKTSFAVVFGLREQASEDDAFWFLSPTCDATMNDAGRVRLDPEQVAVLRAGEVAATPWLLKAAFRGNSADQGLIARLMQMPCTLDRWWNEVLGLHEDHVGYCQGGDEGRKKHPAGMFRGLPELRTEAWTAIGKRRPRRTFIPTNELPTFAGRDLQLPRHAAIFAPPLLIVPERTQRVRTNGRAALALEGVCYSESFFGWSSAQYAKDPELPTRFLHLLFNSDLPLYVSNLTSAKDGTEREVVLLEDLQRLPLPSEDILSRVDRDEVFRLSEALCDERSDPWGDIDAWIARTWGLRRSDMDTIRDAVATLIPEEDRNDTLATPLACKAWWEDVAARLNPLLAPFGQKLRAQVVPPHSRWSVCVLGTASGDTIPDLADILMEADDLAAAEVIVRRPGALWIARDRGLRYWTPTRARLMATHLVHHHGDHLAGRDT